MNKNNKALHFIMCATNIGENSLCLFCAGTRATLKKQNNNFSIRLLRGIPRNKNDNYQTLELFPVLNTRSVAYKKGEMIRDRNVPGFLMLKNLLHWFRFRSLIKHHMRSFIVFQSLFLNKNQSQKHVFRLFLIFDKFYTIDELHA